MQGCGHIKNILQNETPTAIGVSFGGSVDATTGTVSLSHQVEGWENIPLSQLPETCFGVPASVDNNANIAQHWEMKHRCGVRWH